MIRLITMNIFLANTPAKLCSYGFQNFDVTKYHNVNFVNPDKFNEVEFEEFDFNIIKPNINPLADSAINEVWPLLRLLWRARGGYTMLIKIDPEKINNEFGNRLGCNYDGIYYFSINDDGEWTADFNIKFQQDENAWRYQDYSRETSMSARRARVLAVPGSKGEVMWNHAIYDTHIAALEEHKKLDFSFKYNYKGTGKW